MTERTVFYVVATPIGNLSDMSYRAIETLKSVDVILCEDTRVTKKLCDHYEITTYRESYHAHSSDGKESSIISRIKEGKTFALVSDAGTPAVSDPGVKLIASVRELGEGVDIVAIPGPTALITALVSTGFSGNDFRFFGFIPHKKGRKAFFESIAEHPSIAICYESPHRVIKTLQTLSGHDSFKSRIICVARELTKTFEEKQYGTALELFEFFSENPGKVVSDLIEYALEKLVS